MLSMKINFHRQSAVNIYRNRIFNIHTAHKMNDMWKKVIMILYIFYTKY